MGGTQTFVQRLTYALNNNLIDYGNEPSFYTICWFDAVNRPDLAAYWENQSRNKYTVNGNPGDDDSGAMASLYVFLDAGIFPIAGQDIYYLIGPHVGSLAFNLSNGNVFDIIGNQVSPTNLYIQSVTLNGLPLSNPWIRHADIVAGGILEFTMGPTPSAWGNPAPFIYYFTNSVPIFSPSNPSPVTLGWSITNATAAWLTPGIGSVPVAGTVVVNPAVTTTYVLSASNSLSTNLVSSILTVPVEVSPALVAYYPLNETSGQIAHDGSGNGRNLTTTSAPNSGGLNPAWMPAGGPMGGALWFDATSGSGNTAQQFVWSSPTSTTGLILTNYPFTLAGWIQASNVESWTETWLFVGDDTSSSAYFLLGIQNGMPGYADLAARNGSTSQFTESSAAITNGNWHHVAGVCFSPTNRTLYVDGMAANTNTVSVSLPNCNRIGIGGNARSSPTDDVNGGLADVGIWAQALSPQQIALLNGLGRFQRRSLTNSAIAALLALYDAKTGSLTVGTLTWAYATNLTGALGFLGGSVAGGNAWMVLGMGDGVKLVTSPSASNLLRSSISNDGHFQMAATGTAGYTYAIQSSLSVAGPWTTATNVTVGANGLIQFEDPTTPLGASQFYRTVAAFVP